MFSFSQQGEWWIQDGSAMFADGDIGDYNHEAMVIETVRSNIAGYDEDWEGWKRQEALEILAAKKQELEQLKLNTEDTSEIDEKLYEIWKMEQDIDYYAPEIISENLNELGITEEDWGIAEGHGDARLYGMQKYGWKRLESNHIETWTLTPRDMSSISSGLYDAYDENATRLKYYIHVLGAKKFYTDVPWEVINSENPMELREYDSQVQIRAYNSLNWYKRAKLAQVNPRSMPLYQYVSIGHNWKGQCKNFIWIFTEGKLYVADASKENTHLRTFGPRNKKDENNYKGRIEICEGQPAKISIMLKKIQRVPNFLYNYFYREYGSDAQIYEVRT